MDYWLDKISPCIKIVGNAATTSGWIEPMRYIYEHELVLFENAKYNVEVDGKSYNLDSGFFIIIPPGQKHITVNSNHRPGHRYWTHFNWVYSEINNQDMVMTYCPATPNKKLYIKAPSFIPAGIIFGKIKNFSLLLEQFKRLEYLFNFGDSSQHSSCRGIFLEILLSLLADKFTASESCTHNQVLSKNDLSSTIRRQLSKLAEQPASEPIMVQEFLERSGLSYAHQSRVFKKCYGITPLQYITELRMTRAKLLLRDSNNSISQIALILGYDNLGYFSRTFKKSFGISPKDFRTRVKT